MHDLANLLLVTVIAQFTAKMKNSEKSIYFLSFMSCSINKLKSHLFFTCKNSMFSDPMFCAPLPLGQVTNTKFTMKVSNEVLVVAAKCQGYSFYRL